MHPCTRFGCACWLSLTFPHFFPLYTFNVMCILCVGWVWGGGMVEERMGDLVSLCWISKKNGFIPFNKEYNCSLLHISIQPSIHPSIQVFCQDIICITHLPHLGKLNLGLTKVHLEVTKF